MYLPDSPVKETSNDKDQRLRTKHIRKPLRRQFVYSFKSSVSSKGPLDLV